MTLSRVSEDSTLVDQMISSPPAVPALDISSRDFHGLPTPRERELTTSDDSTNRKLYVTVALRLFSCHPSRMHNQRTHSAETAHLLIDTSTPRGIKKEARRENATDNAPKENLAVNSTSTLKDLKLELELIIPYSPNKTIIDWVSENLNLIKHGNGSTLRDCLILKALVKELIESDEPTAKEAAIGLTNLFQSPGQTWDGVIADLVTAFPSGVSLLSAQLIYKIENFNLDKFFFYYY